ncbi:MAG: hypothetical protein A3K22_01105 [Deltaproteobacteria bacterium RBG_16_42_7]|nr:MAG: hypothetical protein A3K22_01105 [Deltaproteobacteria bacterium RBG_16_42_7]
MNRRHITTLGFLAIFTAIGVYVWSQWSSYHNFEGQCSTCHLTMPVGEGLVPSLSGRPQGSPLLFTKDISALCLSCHKDAVRLSHPVDMKPSMKIPSDFLLDRKGNLTCNSCHTIHKAGHGKYHLRIASIGEPFCIACHQGISEGLHRSSIGSAHMGSSVASRYWPGTLDGYLDELSIKCLICHDAAFANEALVATTVTAGEYEHGEKIGLSHPVGVSYRETGAYRKIEKLAPEIKLFDGRVGCGSCHNPYGRRHFELVMSNEGSALCFACHMK